MSDTVNPYQSPGTAAAPVKPLVAQGSLTETMLIYLKGASPWLRFIGILGFIGTGTTALWGIFFFTAGLVTGQVWNQIPGFNSLTEINGNVGVAFTVLMGLLTVGLAALIFFPSRYTYRFGAKIRIYLREGREQDLEMAFKNNKSLWKFYGIIGIVYLAFIPVTIIIGIIAAVASILS